MKKAEKQAIRSIRTTLLSKAPNQVSAIVAKFLDALPPQNPNWTRDLCDQLGYAVIDGYLSPPSPRDLVNALKAQHIDSFYQTFILLACRAKGVAANVEALEILLAELEHKDMTDYDQIDANIVSLVKTLNAYPEVTTIGSCGGHKTISNPGQWTEGSWYVKFLRHEAS